MCIRMYVHILKYKHTPLACVTTLRYIFWTTKAFCLRHKCHFVFSWCAPVLATRVPTSFRAHRQRLGLLTHGYNSYCWQCHWKWTCMYTFCVYVRILHNEWPTPKQLRILRYNVIFRALATCLRILSWFTRTKRPRRKPPSKPAANWLPYIMYHELNTPTLDNLPKWPCTPLGLTMRQNMLFYLLINKLMDYNTVENVFY